MTLGRTLILAFAIIFSGMFCWIANRLPERTNYICTRKAGSDELGKLVAQEFPNNQHLKILATRKMSEEKDIIVLTQNSAWSDTCTVIDGANHNDLQRACAKALRAYIIGGYDCHKTNLPLE